MALAVPILALLLFGLLDVGRVFHAWMVVENAAREAARYGASYPTQLEAARQRARDEAGGAGIAIVETPTVRLVADAGGRYVEALVVHPFGLLFGGFLGIDDFDVTGAARMQVLLDP